MSGKKRIASGSPLVADERKKARQGSPPALLPALEYHQIIVTGPAKCGKSCLVLSFMGELFPHSQAKFLSKQYLHIDSEGKEAMIWDLDSREEFTGYRMKSYQEADIAFLCFDMKKPTDLQEEGRTYLLKLIQPWYKEIKEHCGNIPIVLVGLKSDLKMKSDEVFTKKECEYVRDKCNIPEYDEVSAFINKNRVKTLFEKAIKSVTNPKPKRMFENCGFEILGHRWLQ